MDRLQPRSVRNMSTRWAAERALMRSEEHTSELQSRQYLVCRLLLEKKKKQRTTACLLYNPPINKYEPCFLRRRNSLLLRFSSTTSLLKRLSSPGERSTYHSISVSK